MVPHQFFSMVRGRSLSTVGAFFLILATGTWPTLVLSDEATPSPTTVMTSVTSFSALRSASTDGAHIDVTTNITFFSTVTVNGAVDITSSVGATLDGGGSVRLFRVESGSTLTLSSLTLKNAYHGNRGGAIYVAGGTLAATGCSFMSNRAGYGGAAVYGDASTLTCSDSTFDGNSAEWGGAVYASDSSFAISHSTFESNTASGGGGGLYNYYSSSDIWGSYFAHNQAASEYGGAVAADNGNNQGTMTLSDSTFAHNSAASSDWGGGAVYAYGQVTVSNAAFQHNRAPKGGAVAFFEDQLSVAGSSFVGNSALQVC